MRLALLILVALILTSCLPAPKVDDHVVDALNAAAPALIANETELRLQLERGELPPSIAALDPIAVTLRNEGLFIAMHRRFVRESGVLIARPGFRLRSGGDPSFKPVKGAVYTYEVQG